MLKEELDRTIWRTITLGTHKSFKHLRTAFEKAGMKISDWANDLLNQPTFTLASEKREVDLINMTISELGFKESATYAQILACARELGLDLCPAEVGPQLRLEYKDQPLGEWLIVAMEPVTDSDGNPRLFGVGRVDGGQWLRGDYGGAGNFWGGGDRFVFVLPRK
jgi:hypothetical protein